MWYQRLQRFLYGRYGTDKLSIAILILGLLLSVLGSFLFWPITLLADALYVWALFRTFSRNIPARQKEYAAFLRWWTPIENWLRTRRVRFAQRKQYKYFKCPSCHQELRAPRGRGKIEVTCQKCHNVFRTKT